MFGFPFPDFRDDQTDRSWTLVKEAGSALLQWAKTAALGVLTAAGSIGAGTAETEQPEETPLPRVPV